ncbi:DNA uptake protein ComE [Candidatus Kryptobacter tengchongensis]|nr:DNA uptake protein ComE [Candidatus Kryptobacter tengchongensis]
MKKLVLIFLIIVAFAKSQDVEVDTLKNLEEEILENLEVDAQIDEITEQFEFIRIELNKADIDDLTELPFISREVANKIIEYREKIGGFKAREQVFDIPEVDEGVKLFLYRNGYIQKPKLSFQLRTRVLNKNNIKNFGENFDENFKTYQLGRFAISNFSGGYIIEKDYGERKINDLTNLFVEYRGSGILRKFIVGNYILQFGQGILMWRPVSLGKGSDAILPAVRSFENYSSGYISTDEVKPMFGGVVNLKFKNFESVLFYSKTNLASSVDSLDRVRYIDFSGINTGARVSLLRNLIGGIVSFSWRNFSFGILNFYEKLNRDFSPSISRPFQRESFYSGFEFDLYFRNLNLFGEIGSKKLLHFSYVTGLTMGFGDLNFVFHFRKLNPNFISINGNVFSERYGEAWNEEGFYSGVKFKIWKMRFSGYWDMFKFPRFDLNDVKNGDDRRIEISFAVSRSVNFKFMFRQKVTVEGIKNIDEFGRTFWGEGVESRRNIRFELENKFKKISFRSRVEVVRRNLNGVEKGILIYQGVKCEILNNLKIYGRIAFFRTDSYWSRIYVYEDDIDGVVSLIPFYGNGLRWYLVVKYKFGKLLSLQIKYGESLFIDREVVRNNLGIQVELKI